jgi:hypothetical protein
LLGGGWCLGHICKFYETSGRKLPICVNAFLFLCITQTMLRFDLKPSAPTSTRRTNTDGSKDSKWKSKDSKCTVCRPFRKLWRARNPEVFKNTLTVGSQTAFFVIEKSNRTINNVRQRKG